MTQITSAPLPRVIHDPPSLSGVAFVCCATSTRRLMHRSLVSNRPWSGFESPWTWLDRSSTTLVGLAWSCGILARKSWGSWRGSKVCDWRNRHAAVVGGHSRSCGGLGLAVRHKTLLEPSRSVHAQNILRAGLQIHELVVVSAPPPRRDVTYAVRHNVPLDDVLISRNAPYASDCGCCL